MARSSQPAATISGNDPKVETAARLRLAVGRLARRMRRQDESGLPLTQSAVVATLARRGPMTLGDLATTEQVAPPTMTRVVGLLEAQGFVRRRSDDQDRRVVRVELSAKGRRQFDADRNRRVAWLAARLGELDPADVERLDQALDVLEELAGVAQPNDEPAPSSAPDGEVPS